MRVPTKVRVPEGHTVVTENLWRDLWRLIGLDPPSRPGPCWCNVGDERDNHDANLAEEDGEHHDFCRERRRVLRDAQNEERHRAVDAVNEEARQRDVDVAASYAGKSEAMGPEGADLRERQGGLRGDEPIPWYALLTFEEVRERLLTDRTPGKWLEVPPGFMDWLVRQELQGPVAAKPAAITLGEYQALLNRGLANMIDVPLTAKASEHFVGHVGVQGSELCLRAMSAKEINGVLEELVAAKAENERLTFEHAKLLGVLGSIRAAIDAREEMSMSYAILIDQLRYHLRRAEG